MKRQAAIEETLNHTAKNRGLWFDVEMVKYCGREFSVLRRVERIIEDNSGRMLRLFCPRMMPQYWREAWLERVE